MNNSKKEVSMRLRYLRDLKGMTIQEFSDFLNLSKGTVEKYLNASTLPNAAFLSTLHSKMRVSAHWVLDGVEPMYLIDAGDMEKTGANPLGFGENRHNSGKVFPTSAVDGSDFVPIPRYEIDAAAGTSALSTGEESPSGVYAFNRQWIKRRGLDVKSLHIVTVKGDSMEPRLANGDLILIDTSQSNISEGCAYAVRIGNDLLVKYVQRSAPDKITLISENPRYDRREIDLPVEDDGEIRIVGRVVSSMQNW